MVGYYAQLLGVAVFACSGCVAAGRKQLDLVGIVVVAMVTAVGGGTLRDLLLDRSPVFWIDDPGYIVVVLITTAFVTLYIRFFPIPNRLVSGADALGLSLFAISGTRLAEMNGESDLIALTMGIITGTAGGVVRDLLCNEIPLVMRRGHLYATAALAGSGVYILLSRTPLNDDLAAGLGMLTCACLRFASIIFGIRLPLFQPK